MAEWCVRLEGNGLDLLDLAEHVQGAELSVTGEAGEFYLRSVSFQSCRDAAEVLAYTHEILPLLNGAACVYIGSFRPVSAGIVLRVDDNGTRQAFVVGSGAVALRG